MALLGFGLLQAGCSRPAADSFQGYIEGEFVYVASPRAGALLERPVRRGDTVHTGQALFALERAAEEAAVAEAERRVTLAQARLDNLRKGRRPSEIASLEARLAESKAALDLAETELARREKLRRDEVISVGELDSARTRRDAGAALVRSLTADLETARLGGREDEIRASEAEVAVAEAVLRGARWALDQKSQAAPGDAVVQDTLFEPGEFVPAGSPVIVLLPPANRKVRFFVPEARLPAAVPGAPVRVRLDGVEAPIEARISFVSARPEFTPPVIFSREMRQKLVFRVEATFAPGDAAPLNPGQPVDVQFGR